MTTENKQPSLQEQVLSTAQLIRAGKVKRYHTEDLLRDQTVAEHSWGVLLLVLLLGGDEITGSLLQAAALHDCHEKFFGDIPAPAKWSNPEFAKMIKEVEEYYDTMTGIQPLMNSLTEEQRKILKSADMLEMALYILEERIKGNTNADVIFWNILQFCIEDSKSSSPVLNEKAHSVLNVLIQMYVPRLEPYIKSPATNGIQQYYASRVAPYLTKNKIITP